MKIDGFNLLLQDYCAYCPDFEPEIEKIDCSSICEPYKYFTNIRCENRRKCARIVVNFEERLNDKTRNDTED